MNRGVILLATGVFVAVLKLLPLVTEDCYSFEDYKVKRSTGGPFVIHYPQQLSTMAETVEDLLIESTVEIAAELGLESVDTIYVFLVPDEQSYRRLHRGILPEWSAAFSAPSSRVLGIYTAAVLRTPRPLRTVIRHELSHLLLAQRIGGVRCPTWFMEGLAMMQSHEWTFRDQWGLVNSIWKGGMPDLEDLDGPFPRPAERAQDAYRLSYVAVEELLRERPEDLITLTAFTRDLGNFERAFAATFGESPEDFAVRLHILVARRYKAPVTLINSAPYWLLFALLFILAYVVKRIRSSRKLKSWES